ncbi:MAG: ComF family protein [Bacteroidales bacterium]|nr:ComF family protein [Bacteroidales bacterium]
MNIRSLFSDFFLLFFPDFCEACNSVLLKGENVICTKCLHDLPRTRYHNFSDNKISLLFWGRVPFAKATAFMFYRKDSRYAELFHKLKYNSKKNIGVLLGEMFAVELQDSQFLADIDILLPVPLHKKRLKIRGYNQSEVIALGMQKKCTLSIDVTSIKRVVYNLTQTKKNKESRFTNVSNIFSVVDVASLANKHVLVVDDIVTTGATLESFIHEIEKIQGIKISIATVGIAE